jgi:hypothetical protein
MPSGQLEQDKSKEIEPLKLSNEDVGSWQSFANSLEQNPAAQRGFRKLLNDKGAMDGMRNLMQDEEFRQHAISEMRNEKSVEQAISLLEGGMDSLRLFAHSLERNPAALQGCRKLLNDKEAMEGMKNLMQNEELRRRAISELRDKESVKRAISLLENEESNSTCTEWYKKYVSPGNPVYYNCCKDEGNSFCEGNVKIDGFRLEICAAAVVAHFVLCAFAYGCYRGCNKDDKCSCKCCSVSCCPELACIACTSSYVSEFCAKGCSAADAGKNDTQRQRGSSIAPYDSPNPFAPPAPIVINVDHPVVIVPPDSNGRSLSEQQLRQWFEQLRQQLGRLVSTPEGLPQGSNIQYLEQPANRL